MIHRRLPDIDASYELLDNLFSGPPAVQPPCASSPLVLYGAGNLGQLALRLLQDIGVEVPYILDRNPPACGKLLNVPIITPDCVPPPERRKFPIGICVVTGPYRPMQQALLHDGWKDVQPIYDRLQPHANTILMENGWFLQRPDKQYKDKIRQLLEIWHDDHSRAAHLQFLAWRYARQEWTFDDAPIEIGNRYFIPEVIGALGDNEYFLDAGAYDGSVTARFIELTAGKFAKGTLIEPDATNRLKLIKRFEGQNIVDRIQILDCALDERSDKTRFADGLDLGSRLHHHKGETITAKKLDDLELQISFAKLHLEGHELPALRGGIQTLRRHRPVIAVTVYHNADGAWPAATFLHHELQNYCLKMRLHGWCGTAAVVYAIPKERMFTV